MSKDLYLVRVPRVPGVARARMAGYIQEAVACWGGQLAPAHVREDLGMDPEDCDPLGPPCVLGKPKAVGVLPLPRPRRLPWPS